MLPDEYPVKVWNGYRFQFRVFELSIYIAAL